MFITPRSPGSTKGQVGAGRGVCVGGCFSHIVQMVAMKGRGGEGSLEIGSLHTPGFISGGLKMGIQN